MADVRPSEPVEMVKLDRRRNRLALPGCPECGEEEPRVLMRTDFVLYVRCEACAVVWTVWRP